MEAVNDIFDYRTAGLHPDLHYNRERRRQHGLDEAAQMDGLNFFGVYLKIILPLIRPAPVAVAIFTFVWNWGALFGPLIYIDDVSKMPLDGTCPKVRLTVCSSQPKNRKICSTGMDLLPYMY